MIDDPNANEQLELFRQIAKEAIYDAYTLAEEYGLSDGQARALIKIHGPGRLKLDKIIAAQPFL
ncbi:hypothetical protein [Hoeflea sp. 108]|uniref:hypothetical protein n=1 Tax=Hoeflea sp. 108 TaxID=1116369 RepID=UPI000369573B|nr:hypothetical protein [Hoeflea sp. 108]